MKIIKAVIVAILPAVSIMLMNSCRKCTMCTAYDSITNEIKFQEESCSNGPLLDDWKSEIKDSYPAPQYNTTCE